MDINADFTKRAVVHAADIPWVPSPMPGVERRMLDRIGDEVARATSIVRYAPGSAFSAHTHDGGEEFLVLEGVFQDEHGDFPVGTYVRNPPTTRHTPSAAEGAVILVKLWQMDPDDRSAVTIDVAAAIRDGATHVLLHEDVREQVRIAVWEPGQSVEIAEHDGLEVFVMDGSFDEGGEVFARQSWLRLPVGEVFHGRAGPEGAQVWIKSGHLAVPPVAPGA